MRIALAGISHETNTYCQGQTQKEAFYLLRGEKMLSSAGQENDVGGAVDACAELGVEAVPILFANTQPSGVIARAAYEDFKEEILHGLAEALVQGIDGCVLLLHGAGVVDGIPDLEGDLAAAVREVLGDVPITASFDLHANLTRHMCEQLNGVFVCREYPHIDLHIQSRGAVFAVADMVNTGKRAQCYFYELPLLLPTTTTFEGVGQDRLQYLLDLQDKSDVLNLSWCHGFPYCDVNHVGSFVVASCYEGEQERAKAAALDFAQALWEQREAFRPTSLGADEALQAAELALAEQPDHPAPVVINETSDNCGGGTPGDGTHLLRAMLEQKLGASACFGFIVDEEVATLAHQAGVGREISVVLGGKTDKLHGEPIEATAYVKALHDGRVVMQHMFKGMPLNLGPLARLVIDEMDVVVASRRSQTFDQEPFLAVGIDVMKYDIVALKSSNHFRAGFQHFARAIVTADPPGLSTHHIEVFPRQNTAKALWPINEQAVYP